MRTICEKESQQKITIHPFYANFSEQTHNAKTHAAHHTIVAPPGKNRSTLQKIKHSQNPKRAFRKRHYMTANMPLPRPCVEKILRRHQKKKSTTLVVHIDPPLPPEFFSRTINEFRKKWRFMLRIFGYFPEHNLR
eukprot:GEMP01059592.1.p1 GENE.GEMP01059592.1~~GEMP01059592.1.p1  ORF type:complete len:135 (-),score=15.04 GEMP01059592.1:334-738(-)